MKYLNFVSCFLLTLILTITGCQFQKETASSDEIEEQTNTPRCSSYYYRLEDNNLVSDLKKWQRAVNKNFSSKAHQWSEDFETNDDYFTLGHPELFLSDKD